jgi:hypothetical protein
MRASLTLLGIAFLVSGATACGGVEYGLAPETDERLVPTDDLGDGAGYLAWEIPSSAASSTGTTPSTSSPQRAVPDAPPADLRVERFAIGPAPTPVADFLFVVDDSVSMRRVMSKFRRGVSSLTRQGAFPSGSRIAVLNTTPADPDDPTSPHPVVPPVGDDDLSPGFQSLVTAQRIAAYKAVALPHFARQFPYTGCEAWFSPEARGADGAPCVVAHMKTPHLHKRAEAGLVALRQWLEATEGTPRFRSGAAVNVVFISDTHDPGIPPHAREKLGDLAEALDAERPDFAELDSLVNEPVAAFRVHAIAPETACGEAWSEPTYFDVVDAAGGVRADVCTTRDYSDFIQQIARDGSIRQRTVLRLGYPAAQIESVEVEGHEVRWHETEDPQAITLLGDPPSHIQSARVTYVPASRPPTRSR